MTESKRVVHLLVVGDGLVYEVVVSCLGCGDVSLTSCSRLTRSRSLAAAGAQLRLLRALSSSGVGGVKVDNELAKVLRDGDGREYEMCWSCIYHVMEGRRGCVRWGRIS
jgi:hypothetical protein